MPHPISKLIEQKNFEKLLKIFPVDSSWATLAEIDDEDIDLDDINALFKELNKKDLTFSEDQLKSAKELIRRSLINLNRLCFSFGSLTEKLLEIFSKLVGLAQLYSLPIQFPDDLISTILARTEKIETLLQFSEKLIQLKYGNLIHCQKFLNKIAEKITDDRTNTTQEFVIYCANTFHETISIPPKLQIPVESSTQSDLSSSEHLEKKASKRRKHKEHQQERRQEQKRKQEFKQKLLNLFPKIIQSINAQ